MRWQALLAASVLTLSGCDKIPFIGKEETPPDTAARAPAAPATSADTAQPPAPAPPPQQARRPAPARVLVDEPWTPIDTGTIAPGMTREQVIALWGVPVAERTVGNRTYLYFRNGCEVSCGTFDVVFLEGGQVVDAIVRGPGHNYAGTSSSPRDRVAAFTPPIRQ
ncbi:hypothetical protein HRbin33_02091 [bacterium HR33]|nr:hypothetical protein HRbin33_02091 [bacterium HR33]